jgi:hypothetical protein
VHETVKDEPLEFTFVVRLRRQDGDAEPHWRGSVHEVRSGIRRFVTGTRDISDFIAACLRGEQRSQP